ncbi:MAG: hypothetical protein NZM09_07115, partial [Ignavibacterium sp.]|nr:hypothetical protein [Ignavibacterium sp.]MDW8375451.1 hypothetical protein [Ignavibacteriales bacterium]
MKNLIIIFAFLLLILFISCNENSNLVNTNNSGKVLLKIDRQNAPQGIVLIKATLSRPGFSSIVATMNFLSDTSADLVLNNIPEGTWRLKVDALNDSMVVVYRGETDVNIIAGMVTQINLVLQPTGMGLGSIRIFVTWGIQQSNLNWVDNPTNPVLTNGNNYFDFYGVAQPVLLYEQGKYKMWYYGDQGNAKKHVLYAESIDGTNWIK